jgi:hypothetical protein
MQTYKVLLERVRRVVETAWVEVEAASHGAAAAVGLNEAPDADWKVVDDNELNLFAADVETA